MNWQPTRMRLLLVLLLVAAGCQNRAPDSGRKPRPTPPAEVALPVLPRQPYAVPASTHLPPDYDAPAAQVAVYGNYHTAGVIAEIPEGMTAQQVGQVQCYLNVNGLWQPMHDLVPVRDYGWFATSLFWLQPDSCYQVKVVVLDREKQVRATWFGEGRTRREPVIPAEARALFVATSGDDAHPGTESQPLQTVGQAFRMAEAGTTIWLREGVYYEGDLELAQSGTAERPIVLRACPGEVVVLDGANPALTLADAWQPAGDGLYRHPGRTFASCVVIEDRMTGDCMRLMPVHTLDELRRRAVRPWTEDMAGDTPFDALGLAGGVHQDGTHITLALPGPIADYRIHISCRQFAIRLDRRRHVMIDGITFRHYGAVDFSGGLYLYNAPDIVVQNCRFAFCDLGIGIKGASDRVTIQDCTFTDVTGDWPFSMVKMGGTPCTYETGAVNVTANYSGRGLVFRRNTIRGYFDGAHLTPWTEDDARSNETDFYENVLEGCLDDFIEVDGYARNVRIFDNHMNRSLSGVSLAQALDGPTFVAYNVIANSGVVRAGLVEGNRGRPFKTNGGPEPDVGSGPIFFYHNTAWSSDTNSVAMMFTYAKWARITFRNNIWCGGALGVESWAARLSPMDFDYDNLYALDTNGPLFLISYHNRIDTLEAVRKRLRYLAHGISADPQFRAPMRGDFRLMDDSPCVDAGIMVPGINDGRVLGKAPDLGAYEWR